MRLLVEAELKLIFFNFEVFVLTYNICIFIDLPNLHIVFVIAMTMNSHCLSNQFHVQLLILLVPVFIQFVLIRNQ